MSDPEATQPPVPNTPRNMLKRAWAWLCANPVWFAGIGGFLLGWLAPKVLG